MKNLKLLGLVFLMTFTAMFQSCDDNDGYSLGDIAVDYVTVHVLGEGTYSYTGDIWGTIWPAASAAYPVRLVEGQRAFLYFNPLYDNFSGYDVGVKVLEIDPILTKSVEELTADNAEEYGDDPAAITDVWIGGGYMNVTFQQRLPLSHKHRVSLVENMTEQYPDDGYIHLEYRYNTFGDAPEDRPVVNGIVSFNLGTLDLKNHKGVQLRINSIVNGEKVITLDFESQKAPEKTDQKNFEESDIQ